MSSLLGTRIPIHYPEKVPEKSTVEKNSLGKYNQQNKNKLWKDKKQPKRSKKKILPANIPLEEWAKRLAMLPEDVVHKILNNTTHIYLTS